MSAAEMTPEQAAAMEAQMRYTLGVLMDLDILIALTSNLLYGKIFGAVLFHELRLDQVFISWHLEWP